MRFTFPDGGLSLGNKNQEIKKKNKIKRKAITPLWKRERTGSFLKD